MGMFIPLFFFKGIFTEQELPKISKNLDLQDNQQNKSTPAENEQIQMDKTEGEINDMGFPKDFGFDFDSYDDFSDDESEDDQDCGCRHKHSGHRKHQEYDNQDENKSQVQEDMNWWYNWYDMSDESDGLEKDCL